MKKIMDLTPSTIIDDRMIRGSLFVAVDEAMKFIRSHLKVAFEITGEIQRSEIPEYPLSALRELLLNAVVHRDYTSPTDIQIKIFDNSITFFNPGKLYGGLTVEKLQTDHYQSCTRNKLVAEAFYLTRDIEKYGSGYLRVRKEISEYPTMKFKYEESGDGYVASLRYTEQRTEATQKTTVIPWHEGISEGTSEGIKRLLNLIRKTPGQRIPQLAKAMNTPAKTIESWLTDLKQRRAIEYRGSKKTGGYCAFVIQGYEGISEGTSEGINEGISEGINRLLNLIRKTPGQRIPQLAKAMNTPAKTIERWLADLKQRRAIEYRGSKKTGGYWAV